MNKFKENYSIKYLKSTTFSVFDVWQELVSVWKIKKAMYILFCKICLTESKVKLRKSALYDPSLYCYVFKCYVIYKISFALWVQHRSSLHYITLIAMHTYSMFVSDLLKLIQFFRVQKSKDSTIYNLKNLFKTQAINFIPFFASAF